MGKIDTTLFIKTKEKDMLLVQIYVDDIIFGATNVSLCENFSNACIMSLNEHDGRAQFHSWISNQTIKGMNLH